MADLNYIELADGTILSLADVKTQEMLAYRAEHNAHFRHKNLGTISSTTETNEFMSDYGINQTKLGDVVTGDYFTIKDGTYNVDWMFAGFDTELQKGDTALTALHGSIIPVTSVTNAQMNTTNTTGKSENSANTSGLQAYAGSDMRNITLPAIASKLAGVLGSHLGTRRCLLSNAMTSTTASMAGAGFTGASTSWAWYSEQLTLMSEVQIYGSTICSSSFYDVGEACFKLPVFNFINHTEYGRLNLWLRAVASSTRFAYAHYYGNASSGYASFSFAVRPLGILV